MESTKKKVHLKVVIIGAANVGKTTFVHRYLEKQYSDSVTTLGASFSLKQWRSYNIAIWDTAGEEKFRGLSNFYCRGAGAAIVAFDLTDEDSFHSLRAIFVPLLESALPDCIKIVIGTKADLLSSTQRAVSVEDGEILSREINSADLSTERLYFETSSLSGQNVDQVFEAIFNLCLPIMSRAEGSSSKEIDLANDKTQQTKSNCAC